MIYNWIEMLLIFAVYAILGWITEVVFFTLKTGTFVNRGFLNGPLCPLYGFGVLGVLLIMYPIQDNILLLFIGSMAFCTAIELITGIVLEKLFHDTWWDYTDQPFNFKGYICLRFSIMWGIACVSVIRILHPGIMKGIDSLHFGVAVFLICAFYIYAACDLFVTVRGINNVNRALRKMAERAHNVSEVAGSAISDATKRIDERGDQLKEDIEDRKERFDAKRDAFIAFSTDPSFRKHKRLMEAFPAMRNNFKERIIKQVGEQYRDEIDELFRKRFRHIE